MLLIPAAFNTQMQGASTPDTVWFTRTTTDGRIVGDPNLRDDFADAFSTWEAANGVIGTVDVTDTDFPMPSGLRGA